jgi:hypothetical protein
VKTWSAPRREIEIGKCARIHDVAVRRGQRQDRLDGVAPGFRARRANWNILPVKQDCDFAAGSAGEGSGA